MKGNTRAPLKYIFSETVSNITMDACFQRTGGVFLATINSDKPKKLAR